jgi:hypothetical protein
MRMGKVAWLFLGFAWGVSEATAESALLLDMTQAGPAIIDSSSEKPIALGMKSFLEEPLTSPALTVDEKKDLQQPVLFRDTLGSEWRIGRWEQTPLALVEGKRVTRKDEDEILPALDVLTFQVDLGIPINEVRILGTGGLSAADQTTGSYMWMAAVDPTSGQGVVAGWLTGERGSGVFIPSVVDGKLQIRARLEYGQPRLKKGSSEALESLVIGRFDDARVGLEAYADAVAKKLSIRLRPQPCGYCTWYHAGSSSASRIAALSTFAARELMPFGFSVVQIDDGWQSGEPTNGPRKDFTKHRASGPFAEGMKGTADQIASLSLTPGLWFMPFAGTWNDPFFADKQHWFAKNESGKPFETNWGGTPLDMTHPEAQAFVRENVRRMTHDWGYKYLKMDGLFMGSATEITYVNDAYRDDHIGNTTLHDPQKSHIEALRTGLRIVRESAGSDVFLLGCCAPQNMRSYGGAFGLVDAMRIGPDNSATVENLLIGPRYGSRNYFLHGRVWWNDPDPVYVRRSLSLAQSELICSWAGVTGQLTIASDELERLPADRLNVLRRIMPSHGQPSRPVDLFERDLPRIWVVPASGVLADQTIVGLFNWDGEPIEIDESLERLGLDSRAEYASFDFWSGQPKGAVRERLKVSLAGIGSATSISQEKSTGRIERCSAVISLRPLAKHPRILSTSRHISQGRVDLLAEDWDESSRSLSGTSRIVGNDPYEIRLAVREKQGWKINKVEVDEESRRAGVEIKQRTSEPGLFRVVIVSPESREIHWRADFER